MKRTIRMILAVGLAAAMLLALPAFAAPVGAREYDEHDAALLRAYFEQEGLMSVTNGVALNGEEYDPDDISTWTSCTWTDDGRLLTFAPSVTNVGTATGGSLDLSNCSALTTVNIADAHIYGKLDISNCPALTTVNVTGATHLTSVDFTGSDNITLLWVSRNEIDSIDITSLKQIDSFDCSYNPITELDLSQAKQLRILRCGNCSISELDLSSCPGLTELSCRTNELTELDISMLTNLRLIYTQYNKLTKLDISVLNGGKSYLVDKIGNGYVAVTTSINSSGQPVYYGWSKPMDGESFYGWYREETKLGSSSLYKLPFEGGQDHITAHFCNAEYYTVTFADYDDTVLKTERVPEGGSALAPEDPVREGYTFIGWDKDYSNVTGDITIRAQYKQDGPAAPVIESERFEMRDRLIGDGKKDIRFLFKITLNDSTITAEGITYGAEGGYVITRYYAELTAGVLPMIIEGEKLYSFDQENNSCEYTAVLTGIPQRMFGVTVTVTPGIEYSLGDSAESAFGEPMATSVNAITGDNP